MTETSSSVLCVFWKRGRSFFDKRQVPTFLSWQALLLFVNYAVYGMDL